MYTKIQKAKSLIMVLLVVFLAHGMQAQGDSSSFTLVQAQEFALKNAFSVKSVKYDAEVANNTTQELIGIGLPQINGSATYLNNIYAPYSIIPAGAFGPSDFRIRFQQPHNLTLGVTASQLLFDGTWLVGLEASKSYEQLQNKNIEKSEINTKNDIAQSYYLAVVAGESLKVLKSSRDALANTLKDSEAYYDAGFLEKQDVDQLKLALNDLDIQITYAEEQARFTKDLLKFQMGYPLQKEITLTDDAATLMSLDSNSLLNAPFNPQQNIDVELAQSGLMMQQLNLKAKKAAYLPNLAAAWTIQTQAQRSEFNFFDTKEPYLYGNFLAIQLNVPILSGGQRKYATKKAEVEVRRLTDMKTLAEQAAELEYRNAKKELDNAMKVYSSSQESLRLAEDIYKTAEIKFKEGIGSSMDLTQRNTQVLQAQGSYIQAMLKLLQAKNNLAKALNQY